ncbi:MAG: sigma-54-dependent Fis family transcriptional regulator [bacterium]|nr:sigma-54-dependent Fis family transcriptional regulator [bacterium]
MDKREGKILIVDDDEDVLQAAALFLKQHLQKIITEKNPQRIIDHLEREEIDVILLDMNFTRDASSGKEGFYWLQRIQELAPKVVVILITAFGDVSMAVKAVKAGAVDFILKPWQNEKLLATISAGIRLKNSREQLDSLRSRQRQLSDDLDQPFQDFIGECDSMKAVFRNIGKVAQTEANVLILGENGTGKELVARALHRQSLRANEVFISVDMGAISETLFESELFGHVKGAFTDAKEDRAGRFEVASGGTLFLDEIGNLSVSLQAKLLKVLETRKITRVGSDRSRTIDIRLVCATNMPLFEMAAEQRFRQDLLYRINTIEIKLPPLCERGDDLPLLIEHFLKIYLRKYQKPEKKISQPAMKKLIAYEWPGNVRELQHAIERAVILSEGSSMQPEDFFFSSIVRPEETMLFDGLNLEDIERTVIQRAIEKHGGNISRAAEELGLTRTSLYRRIGKYGI